MMKTNEKVVIIGLGYVGLPLAVSLSFHYQIVGFDKDRNKIEQIKAKKNIDFISEDFKYENIKNIEYTSTSKKIEGANFFIVTVPTPIDQALKPDLSHLIEASTTIGKCLQKGNVVIYESTVYPGATEEVCIPILEQFSGLKATEDFGVAYSPERINPGDNTHTLKNVNKLIAAESKPTLEKVKKLYGKIIKAKIIEVSSIKVAETSKVIENTQRDLNIGLMNELAMICNKLNLDTKEVIEAASSKWNFIPFKPGLVGGHCISVDPYYLTHRAKIEGLLPEIILAGRRVNDNMWKFIVENTLKLMTQSGTALIGAKIGIMGFAFKENCSDFRNSQVLKIYKELLNYNMEVLVYDPLVDQIEILNLHKIKLANWNQMKNLDALIIAVAHDKFNFLNFSCLKKSLKKNGCIIDVKSFLKYSDYNDIPIWKL